uniref:Uncharacterized protein n=1 Tax=Photinus pyralis TaxID=7054 RepID=A0A1Y1NEZ7_PHOPY
MPCTQSYHLYVPIHSTSQEDVTFSPLTSCLVVTLLHAVAILACPSRNPTHYAMVSNNFVNSFRSKTTKGQKKQSKNQEQLLISTCAFSTPKKTTVFSPYEIVKVKTVVVVFGLDRKWKESMRHAATPALFLACD